MVLGRPARMPPRGQVKVTSTRTPPPELDGRTDLEDVLEAHDVRVRDLPQHLRLLHQLPGGQPGRQPELARLDHLLSLLC